jgi:hypothetical protein
MAEQTLTVKIIGDESDLLRSFRASAKATQRFSASFGTFVKGALVFQGVQAGVNLFTGSIRKGIGEASSLNEEINKTRVIFADSQRGILAWSKSSADSLGLARTEALAAAGGFGQMLQTAGLSERQSASFSRRLVELAADMASFNNIDPTEALTKLRSGLAGEAEPLRTVGVLLSEARVKQEAYRLGIAKTGEELTEQQKVQARYALIFKDTAKQQGDFARTSDSLANAQRRIRAALSDVASAIGTAILPGLARLTAGFANILPELQQSFGRLASVAGPAISNFVASFTERLPQIQRVAGSILDPLRERVLPILQEFGAIAAQVWANVISVFDSNRENLRQILDNLGAILANVWTVARPTIVFLFTKALPAALNVAIPILAKITGVVRTLSTVFVRSVSFIVKAIEVFLGGISRLADAASHLPVVGDSFKGIADKVNASRESLRDFTKELDQIDGRKVSVEVQTRFRAIGDAGARTATSPSGREKEKAEKETRDLEQVGETQRRGAERVMQSSDRATQATTKALTAAEKQRAAFDRLLAVLGLRRDRAAATAGLKDDIAIVQATKKALEDQLKVQRGNIDLQRQLFQANQELESLRQQQRQQRQFRALGLTAEGEKRGPSVANLRKRLGTLREQIQGTVLDTAKTEAQLDRIAKVLRGKFGKVGKDVRSAILQMLNDIAGSLKEGSREAGKKAAGAMGEITRGGIRSTEKLIKGLGLTKEQEEAIRRRNRGALSGGLTAFGFAVEAPRANLPARVTLDEGGGNFIINGPITVVTDDPDDFMRQLQKKSARNAGSRRGRHGGVRLGLG